MNPAQKRFLMVVVLVGLALSLVLPITHAQEVTETPPVPSDIPSEVPTDTPPPTEPPTVVPPTEVPTAAELPTQPPTVPPETTEAPTAAPPESTEAPTFAPSESPSTVPTQMSDVPFQDDFQDGNVNGWTLTPGWQLATTDANVYLTASTPNETATVANIVWDNLFLAARVRLDAGNTLNIAVRAAADNYTITLDSSGQTALYRNGTLVAQGSLAVSVVPAVAPWRTVNIQAFADSVAVAVDGTVEIAYTDPQPLSAGAIIFGTGAANTGNVSIDGIVVNPINAPMMMPTVESAPTTEPATVAPTSAPTEATTDATAQTPAESTAEVTAQVPAEVTAQPTAESTSEVTVEPTAESTGEATAEPPAASPVLLSSDFETNPPDGWSLGSGASIVAESDTNHALLLAAAGTLVPANDLTVSDVQFSTRFTILSDAQNGSPSGFSLKFRTQENAAYVLSVEAGQTALYRSDDAGLTLLATSPTTHPLNAWHTLELTADGGHIAASVDGAGEIDFTDAAPLSAGSFAFVANDASSVMLDDIVITSLTATLPEPTATPLMGALTDSDHLKVESTLYDVLDKFVGGDEAGALKLAQDSGMILDDQGRINVQIWSVKDTPASDLVPLITTVGGVVSTVDERYVSASVPLEGILALIHAPQVSAVVLPSRAVSTDSPHSPKGNPVGSQITEGFDVVGANIWHQAGVLGAGVGVAVIDTGFNATKNSDQSCVADTPPNTLSYKPNVALGDAPLANTDHGLKVAEIICDIAPSASVRLYGAVNATEMTKAIEAAQANPATKVIVIAEDLGTDAGPGDGTFGRTATFDPYAAIANARNSGIVVIASAGNSNGRYAAFSYSGTTTIPYTNLMGGDSVRVSWDDWNNSTSTNMSVHIDSPSMTGSRIGGSDPKVALSVPSTSCTSGCSGTLTISGVSGGNPNPYIQVQIIGQGTLGAVSGSTLDTNAGSLARPADSPNVIAVGAVCATGTNYPILADSSHGPIFGAGGTAPTAPLPFNNLRDNVKPDVVAPSQVSVSGNQATVGDCASGFGGTSAAAAHVAGMAALLISNTNTSMDVFDDFTPTSVDALQNYLQSHSADEPLGGTADGFDNVYGAGLTVLGDPNYDLSNTINPPAPITSTLAPAPAGECTAGFIYVGQGDLGDATLNGSESDPYTSIAFALRQAATDQCIVVLPGEYVSPLLIQNITGDNVGIFSYQALMNSDVNDTFFHLNVIYDPSIAGKDRRAGIYVDGENTRVDGFIFTHGVPLQTSIFPSPSAITFNNSTLGGAALRNSTMNDFAAIPNQSHWRTLVQVVGGSLNVDIKGNSFKNDVLGQGNVLVGVEDSGSGGSRIVVERNTFDSNTNVSGFFSLDNIEGSAFPRIINWVSLVRTVDSYADIRNNVFVNNSAETIIQAMTRTKASTAEARVLGNEFLNNSIYTIDCAPPPFGCGNNSGPLVNLFWVPKFYFLNNSVVNNTFVAVSTPGIGVSSAQYGSIIGRGNVFTSAIDESDGGLFPNDANQSIANNLIYTDTTKFAVPPGGIFKGMTVGSGCADINGNPNQATQFNLIFPSGQSGECSTAINNVANNNITTTDPGPTFVGKESGGAIPTTDPFYYAPGQAPKSPLIDAGDSTLSLANSGAFGSPNPGTDIQGSIRIAPVPPPPFVVDIGAYEVIPLNINVDPLLISATEDVGTLGSSNGIVLVNLNANITGGIGKRTFIIDSSPSNFGRQCGAQFAGTPGYVMDQNTGILSYCLPRDFYNQGLGASLLATFFYTVKDQAGNKIGNEVVGTTGRVDITVDPVNDQPLAGVIGDGTPSQDIFEVTANAGEDVQFRLRPYVTFNNFSFSERNNTEGTIGQQADYPFLYSASLTLNPAEDYSNPALITANAVIDTATGLVDLDLTPLGLSNQTGFGDFTYQVQDVNGHVTTNHVHIVVISQIPSRGLLDDSSFAFNYQSAASANDPGKWVPVYSEANINNTLHQTTQTNDKAVVRFTGDGQAGGMGFVLFMQGSQGGKWTLKINGVSLPNWTVVNGEASTVPFTVLTDANVVCVTRQPVAAGTNSVLNSGVAAYTVSCSGLSSSSIHTVEIINQEAKKLSVDALAIVENNTAPTLGPGLHYVNEYIVGKDDPGSIFNAGAWTLVKEAKATGGVAMTATTFPVTTTFSFTGGTGFAIGTDLEKKLATNTTGALYTICVQQQGAPPSTQVCQKFDNGLGGTSTPIYQVFRPFFGFKRTNVYDVTLTVTNVPAGERMFVDSIVIFSDDTRRDVDANSTPVSLPLGNNEDDGSPAGRDLLLFGGGLEDSWSLNANNTAASNKSLTSMVAATKAGPYLAFRIPSAADTLYVFRVAGKATDSQNVLVCVDRGIGTNDGTSEHLGNCKLYDLRAAGNPLVIKASDFPIGASWGAGDTLAGGQHTVEMFSLTNQPFNMDRVLVVNSTGALTSGRYEETTTNITYWECSAAPCTSYTQRTPTAYDKTLNNFTAPFTLAAGKDPDAARTSGASYVQTAVNELKDGVNGESNAIMFRMTGTGFSVYFTQEKFASVVDICWVAGTVATPDAVLTDPNVTCQTFNNNAAASVYQAARTVLGLSPATPVYTVVVRMRDNADQPTSGLPIAMKFDGVQIYNTDWTTLNTLSTLGTRYETSFTNRAADNLFQYFGSAWASFSGVKAFKNSGSNYDQTKGVVGAGVLFKTDNANAILLYRDTGVTSFAPLQVCSVPYSGTAVTLAQEYCTVIYNTGGAGNQQPAGFLFNTTNDTSTHLVWITTLDNTPFDLDAIELVNTVSPLTAGTYEEFQPSLVYDRSFSNALINGGMERDSDWASVNGPTTNVRSSTRQSGSFSRQVVTSGATQGIESQPFTITAGQTIFAHVMVSTAGQTVTMLNTAGTPFTVTSNATFSGKWQILRFDYTGPTVAGATLRFIANGAATFYVDTASVVTGGNWHPVFNGSAADKWVMESTTPGARMTFSFTGTGFEIGLPTAISSGEVEICYSTNIALVTDPTFVSPTCLTYQNESKTVALGLTISRTILGLPLNTYYVRVREADDGLSQLGTAPAPRLISNDPARLRIDYVRIYNTPAPAVIPPPGGIFNDDSAYLQLLPAERWGQVTPKTGSFTNNTYQAIIGTNGNVSALYAGPTALLTVGQNAAVILYTGAPSTTNSSLVRVCVDDVSSANCVTLTSLTTSSQIVVNSGLWPALSGAGTHVLSFTALTPGNFNIDGFQVIYNTELQPGYYENTLPAPLLNTTATGGTATWTTISSTSFSGGNALQGTNGTGQATFSFDFFGTGFSLVTLLENNTTAGTINVHIHSTTAGYDSGVLPVSVDNLTTLYGASLTFAGLPLDHYTVTITNVNATRLVVDAVQVYGDPSLLGSLYDDSQTDSNGNLIFTYGPSNNSWTAKTAQVGYLNLTNHYTRSFGAAVNFKVGAVNGITLYPGKASKATVNVCWYRISPSPTGPSCSLVSTVTTTGLLPTINNPLFNASGQYQVSIVNNTNLDLYIDAIQTVSSSALIEGIYQETYSGLGYTGTVANNTSNVASDGKIKDLANGAAVEFQMQGIGFSMVVVESAASSTSYQLCVNQGATTNGGINCSTIPSTGLLKSAGATGQTALTYMGLQSATDANQTYFVYLKNTDPIHMLSLDRVEIMGAIDPSLQLTTGTKVESGDPRLIFLPFGSFTPLANKAASGGSQHTAKTQGATAYFEFIGRGFEYSRQLATGYGQVQVCYGKINNTTSITTDRTCAIVGNNTANTYQSSYAVDPGASFCVAPGCWVSITSLDNKIAPVDFVRMYDPNDQIAAGYYEAETYPSLRFFNNDAPTYSLTGSSFTTKTDVNASGGVAMISSDIGEGMTFKFHGTGFAILFTQDAKSDAVKVCWKQNSSSAFDVNTILISGTCQIFDNQSSRTVNQARRTILGLDENDWDVAVQLMDDNFTPTTHTATTTLPISMQIDALEIYDDPWFLPTGGWTDTTYLNALTPGTRYEPSFAARGKDNNFLYYGSAWKSIANATGYSGLNYDQTKGVIGAGILFRTNGADSLILYRDTKSGNAPLMVCAAPVIDTVAPGNPDSVDLTNRYCTTIINGSGTAVSQPYGVLFNTLGTKGPYVVSITTLDSGLFTLDALELVDTDSLDGAGATPLILGAGIYEDAHPGLQYDRSYTNLIVNGDMERDNLAGCTVAVGSNTCEWAKVGQPTINERIGTHYTGGFGRHITAVGGGRGMQSLPMTLTGSQTYTIIAHVNVKTSTTLTGTAKMLLVDGGGNPLTGTTVVAPTTAAGKWLTLRLDYTPSSTVTGARLQIISGGSGAAEFFVDDVSVTTGGLWEPFYTPGASGGRAMESLTAGASLRFQFTGTGFEIGTVVDKLGGEARVCYVRTDVLGVQKCFTYEQESKTLSATVSRPVVGLPSGTYTVTFTDVEDGRLTTSKTATDPRLLAVDPARLRVDYVRIYNDPAPSVLPAGFYNENVKDNAGSPYLQQFPPGRWANISGTAARGLFGGTYTTVADSTGRASKVFAGPVALLRVNVPSADGVTLVLYTGAPSASNSSQLLVCVDNVSGTLTWNGTAFSLTSTDCTLVSSLLTTSQAILNPLTLPGLGVPGPHVVSFRSLSPSTFNIDAFQIIEGTSLAAGIYDELIPDPLLDFSPNVNHTSTCNLLTEWCLVKSSKAFGGNVMQTSKPNGGGANDAPTLTFNFSGTGFSVVTGIAAKGGDMRICYKPASSTAQFPNDTITSTAAHYLTNPVSDPLSTNVFCETVTTNSIAATWAARNKDRVAPNASFQYGFAYYGLPNGDYTVEVRRVDTLGTTYNVQIDAIVVFGDATQQPLMTPGLYDNVANNILYSPGSFWTQTTSTSGPTKGPYKGTENTATNAGAIVQLNVEGNAVTIYQTVSTSGSANVRICLVVTGTVVHCSTLGESLKANQINEISQNGKTTYFTPIVIYGLGTGTHQIIIENRNHGKTLSIDAIRVWN